MVTSMYGNYSNGASRRGLMGGGGGRRLSHHHDDSSSVGGSSGCFDDCLGRVPYASLIAFLLTAFGAVAFCLVSYYAVNLSIDHGTKLEFMQQIDFQFLDKIRTVFMALGVSMLLFCCVLLIVGCLATGATRHRIYGGGWKARLGGRLSCACLLSTTYLCLLVWLLVFGTTTVIGCLYWFFIWANCMPINSSINTLDTLESHSNRQNCVGFGFLGQFMRKSSVASTDVTSRETSNVDYKLCGYQTVLDFCQTSIKAAEFYSLAWLACLLVIVGLVHFLICLAANYAHIKDGYKARDLDEIQLSEENELMTNAVYGDHCVYRR